MSRNSMLAVATDVAAGSRDAIDEGSECRGRARLANRDEKREFCRFRCSQLFPREGKAVPGGLSSGEEANTGGSGGVLVELHA
jgi:hypothetical protein